MYALHLAISAIRSGDCDSAIVAASTSILDPHAQFLMAKLGTLSPTSACHSFDASADGYARGEGYAALYIKKATQAVEDGYPIRAFIRGTAINANGRTGGITHPSKEGQEAVIRMAYQNAGDLPLSETTYFECHGTGTPVGDPVEIAAIGNVFASTRTAEDPLLVGSIKTNIGHTESASAIAGIMKVVLSMESGFIPPSINVHNLNPKIDFQTARAKVVRETIPWPPGRLRRASINSFGYGGANGHCIVDHVNNVLPYYTKPGIALPRDIPSMNGSKLLISTAEEKAKGIPNPLSVTTRSERFDSRKIIGRPDSGTPPLVVLPLSAHNESSLKLNITALTDAINKHSLADVAYTLCVKRSRFMQRTFRIVERDDPTKGLKLDEKVVSSGSQIAKVGFVFTGQGAQWNGMGKELLQYRVFQDTLTYLDHILSLLPSPPDWKTEDFILGTEDAARINIPEVSQTVCTALQVGVIDLLHSWGVRPTAVVGHSSGEIAAAYAAGRITAAEAITTAYYRGQAVSHNEQKGAMLAVGLSSKDVEKYLCGIEQQVVVAAINSPSSVTLSGDIDAIIALSEKLISESIFNRMLQTGGNAYHSHHMKALGDSYEKMLTSGLEHIQSLDIANADVRYAAIPWVSSVTPDQEFTTPSPEAAYWRSNLESPVQFSDALINIVKATEAPDVLIEIGPHAALKGPISQIMKSIDLAKPYISSLMRKNDGQECLLRLAGTLFGLNAEIDLVAVNAVDSVEGTAHTLVHGCTAVDLPPYQYAYGPIVYAESRFSKEYRNRKVPHHDLLGSKLPGNAKLRPQWRNLLRLKDVPWLGHHKLLPHPLLPAVGYCTMAIEAATQAYNDFSEPIAIEGFSIRNFNVGTGMQIPEDDYGLEVITSLELVDSATAKSPAWTNFSISSTARDSDAWTEHCTGQIRIEVGESRADKKMPTEMDARAYDTRVWYQKFTEIGLDYGATFQGLSDICGDPTQNLATAKVDLKTTTGLMQKESGYSVHPTSLDAGLQLAFISIHGGQTDRVRSAFVPVHFDRFYLKNGVKGDWATAICKGELKGLRAAYTKLQMLDQSGEVILDIPSIRCLAVNEQSVATENKSFSAPLCRLVWRPDVRTITNEQARKLFPPPQTSEENTRIINTVERLGALVVAEINDRFPDAADQVDVPKHIQYLLNWTKKRIHDDIPHMTEAKLLQSADRIRFFHETIQNVDDCADIKAFSAYIANLDDLLHGRKSGLDVLAPSQFFKESVIGSGAYAQLARYLDYLGHANPNMTICEVGAGGCAATKVALKTLTGENGIKRYKKYTVTDIWAEHVSLAKELLVDNLDVDCALLNVELDPISQGFERYDVVLASQCLHTTSSIARSLENCRKMLNPGGKLILIENIRSNLGQSVILGVLPGYWSGMSDERIDHPYLSLDRWNSVLMNGGFSGTELVLDDYAPPHTTACIIISSVSDVPCEHVDIDSTVSSQQEVCLVFGKEQPEIILSLANELKRRGIPSRVSSLQSIEIQANSHAIAFLDNENLLVDTDEQTLQKFQALVRSTSRLLCLTNSGMMDGKHPDAAVVTGLLRTIGTENPSSRYVSLDIDADSNINEQELIDSIVAQMMSLRKESTGEREDREFIWRDKCLWVSRAIPDTNLQRQYDLAKMSPKFAMQLPFDCHGPIRAHFETPGLLTSLYFAMDEEMLKPLKDNWIQVKVAAVGLNWKNLAVCAGRFDSNFLSSEFAGVVDKVGSAVTNVAIGQRVYGFGEGHFGNYVRTRSDFAIPMRPQDDFVKMASIPLVCMTAVYAFQHLTQIRKGEKVLIQSATGGLGLAAIQFAQAKGAEVFATAGTAEKMHYLVNTIGIPASHVFTSRSEADIPKLIEASGGKGFDIILSTASGDLLYESFKALAPLGRFIDVGRVDVNSSKTIGMELFKKCATFTSFDLGLVNEANPDMANILMEAVDSHYRSGNFTPTPIISQYDISELDQALLGFSKGTHVGKLVITFQNPEALIKMVPPVPRARFDPSAEYIITGGLGGLGRSLVGWMAERGARYLTILSRSGSTTREAQDFIKTQAAHGVVIRCVPCDVSILEDVANAVNEITSIRSLKGVVHTAVAYEVRLLSKTEFPDAVLTDLGYIV